LGCRVEDALRHRLRALHVLLRDEILAKLDARPRDDGWVVDALADAQRLFGGRASLVSAAAARVGLRQATQRRDLLCGIVELPGDRQLLLGERGRSVDVGVLQCKPAGGSKRPGSNRRRSAYPLESVAETRAVRTVKPYVREVVESSGQAEEALVV